MKIAAIALAAAVIAPSAFSQSSQVQLQCHALAPNAAYIAPDEVYFNGMACRPVQVPVQVRYASATESFQSAAKAQAGSASDQPIASAVAGQTPAADAPVSNKIAAGSTVYIEPMDGFENYLAAALLKKKVPLVTVTNKDQAQYVIAGTSDEKKAGWAKMAFTGNIHSDNAASVTMSDQRTGAVVFAYAVDKKNTLHGQQTTAEACAKHLQETIKADQK
jgi:hypothetical protein